MAEGVLDWTCIEMTRPLSDLAVQTVALLQGEDASEHISVPSELPVLASEWVDRFHSVYGVLTAGDPVQKQVEERLHLIEKRYKQELDREAHVCAGLWREQVKRVSEERSWAARMESMARSRAERDAAKHRLLEEEVRLRGEEEQERLLLSEMEEAMRTDRDRPQALDDVVGAGGNTSNAGEGGSLGQ